MRKIVLLTAMVVITGFSNGILHIYPEVGETVGDPDVYVQGQVCPELKSWGVELPIPYILHTLKQVAPGTYVPEVMPLKTGVLKVCPEQRGT